MTEREGCEDIIDLTSKLRSGCSLSKDQDQSQSQKYGFSVSPTGRKAVGKVKKSPDDHEYPDIFDNSFFSRENKKSDQYVSPEDYYKAQSCNDFGKKTTQTVVYVQFEAFIAKEWLNEMKSAMKDINTVAPGLNLLEIDETEAAENEEKRPLVRVLRSTRDPHKRDCITFGNIFTVSKYTDPDYVEIYLGINFDGNKFGTSRHELMHALGFEHEHQRCDGEHYLKYPDLSKLKSKEKKKEYISQYMPKKYNFPLTPFDPFSVMFYQEEEHENYCRRDGVNIWVTRSNDTSQNIELSELDKVGLNLFFEPVCSDDYAPTKSANGMYYCKRKVMSRHNWPDPSVAKNNRCVEGGPNCPACRTLSKPTVAGVDITSQWQGWSGLVYCGMNYTISNEKPVKCGINYGESCPDCAKIISAPLLD